MTHSFEIAGRPVGDGHRCFILAEAGCNHNAELDLALRLVDMAADAEADGIKFQTYTADKIYSRKTPMMRHFKEKMGAGDNATMYDLIKTTELPYDMHAPILDHCRMRGIPFLSTPFDVEAVDFLETLSVPAYKIASFEMTHFPLIRKVAQQGKPMILSTGMSNLGDIEKAVSVALGEGNDKMVLLHCVSNYPARPEDYNLRVIPTLKAAFGFPVGLSDHTPGVAVPRIAIALGANLIEKHITVDQSLPGPDHHFSLLPAALAALAESAREIEIMLGSPVKQCVEAEQSMKHTGRRSLVADADIGAGTVLTPDMIAVKRPGYGLHPELMETLVGAVARRDIDYDEPLTWDMFMEFEDGATGA